MKGIVFTSFLELVEEKFGYEMVDKILTSSDLPSKGIYTTVGTYQHREMVSLLTALSRETGMAPAALLYTYGTYFFPILHQNYSQFFEKAKDVFDFLASIDQYIHVEVLKLYPDAELPRFESRMLDERTLEMIYESHRKMSDFAEGLIRSCLDLYRVKATIQKENLAEDGSIVRFTIRKEDE